MHVLAMSIVVGVMASSAAVAQTAAFKCAAPGTIVEFSDGQRTTWIGQDGNKCRLQQKRSDGTEVLNNWFAPTAIVAAAGSQAWADQIKPWTLWPLAVGKKIEGRYDGPSSTAGGSGSWIQKITVEKIERLTIPAGTFDTFVVVAEQEAISHRFKSTFRQWYAVGPGVTIKFEYSDSQPRSVKGEAVSIKP